MKLFIKSEMHKLFINRAKGAKVEPDIKYIKKNGLRFHKHAYYLMSTIKHQNEPKISRRQG